MAITPNDFSVHFLQMGNGDVHLYDHSAAIKSGDYVALQSCNPQVPFKYHQQS